jgi:hypothetical protein
VSEERQLRQLLDTLLVAARKQGLSLTDRRWMVALRRAEYLLHSEDNTGWLIKLLRSEAKMPPGFEMSRAMRDLLVELLGRWHVDKRDMRLTTLFKPSKQARLLAAERGVCERQYRQLTPPGPFNLFEPDMSREQAIAEEVAARRGTEWAVKADQLEDFMLRRINFGRRKKRRKQ